MNEDGNNAHEGFLGYGFRVGIDGTVSTPHPDVGLAFSSYRDELVKMREDIQKQTPYACGCAHEQLVANTYQTRQAFRAAFTGDEAERVVLPLICAENVRQNNPLCAHAGLYLRPAPFGSHAHRLLQMGLLGDAEFIEKLDGIASEIVVIDMEAARRRWAGREWLKNRKTALAAKMHFHNEAHKAEWMKNTTAGLMPRAQEIDAETVAKTRKAQEPIRQKLETCKSALLNMLDRTIAAIDNSTNAAS
jgi:hypothetical protein